MKIKKILKLWPYVLLVFIAFYAFPLLIKDTGSAMLVLLALIPFAVFASSLACGIKSGFSLIFSFIVFLLFLPSVFIFYNGSALIYSVVYLVIGTLGSGIGAGIRKIFTKCQGE